MLDPITRAAALVALPYHGDARYVAAQQSEVAALLGNVGEARAWSQVAKRIVGLSRSPTFPVSHALSSVATRRTAARERG